MFGPPGGSYAQLVNGSHTTTVSEGAINYYDCDSGSYSKDFSTSCSDCGVGTWSATRAIECTPCSAGKYTDTERSSSCHSCQAYEAGRYLGSTGAATCQKWFVHYKSCVFAIWCGTVDPNLGLRIRLLHTFATAMTVNIAHQTLQPAQVVQREHSAKVGTQRAHPGSVPCARAESSTMRRWPGLAGRPNQAVAPSH